MTDRLGNKAAFITGGASGIGAATAQYFVEQGAHVVIADVNEEAGDGVARRLGNTASFQRLDVTNELNWRDSIDAAASHLGRLDILVNSAGISGGEADIEQIELANWQTVMNINLTGTLLGCKNAVRVMKAFGIGGSIINISSVVGIKAWGPRIAYGTSKAAVAHLTKAVALHCGKAGYNIRCNAVHPGTIDTPILDEQLENFGNDRSSMLKALAPFQVLGRTGTPSEIAAAIAFLASDEASFITATSLVVDGGFKEL
jgi:3(or 17)beta-hydroxysteroid dehydrogenase